MDEETETTQDHGFFRFSSPVKMVNRSVYKKKMTSSRIDWNKNPLVKNKLRDSRDSVHLAGTIETPKKTRMLILKQIKNNPEVSMYPLNLNGTKLTIEERAGQVRVKPNKTVRKPKIQNVKSRSIKNTSFESKKSKTSNTDYENRGSDSNRSHNLVDDVNVNAINIQDESLRENGGVSKTLLVNADYDNIMLRKNNDINENKNEYNSSTGSKLLTRKPVGHLSIKDKILELRNINKHKANSLRKLEAREKRLTISEDQRRSITAENCYQNPSSLGTKENLKNAENKFFDHGLINLHTITNLNRESVTQNQSRKFKNIYRKELSFELNDLRRQTNRTIDLSKCNMNARSKANGRSSSFEMARFKSGINRQIMDGVLVDNTPQSNQK